ncbi:DUF2993 domain-containing protein [Micromonospora sp. NPDC049559]|uniref:LmeA family phospholipid-binding protein n=1 Tax=Micromonospora sp. NPDC049559 TaxID=3155923 RepID=UPI003416613C
MTSGYAGYEERPVRRRRGRRVLIVLLVLLLVLVGLLVVADRVAANFAERTIAEQVSQETAKQNVRSAPPEVGVGGFPFLTQVVAGRYESISIVLRDVQGAVEGNSVSLPELDIDARSVHASLDTLRSGQGDVVADTVDGTATISYDSVTQLIKRPGVKLAERNGKLNVTAPLEVLGQRLTVTGDANLTVEKGQVAVRFENLTADGLPDIPAARALVNAYARQISIDIPLPKLPFQLVVREVRVQPNGLAVSATAKNVTLNSGA